MSLLDNEPICCHYTPPSSHLDVPTRPRVGECSGKLRCLVEAGPNGRDRDTPAKSGVSTVQGVHDVDGHSDEIVEGGSGRFERLPEIREDLLGLQSIATLAHSWPPAFISICPARNTSFPPRTSAT